ncbi:hypothetical protein [Frateuria soli]|uniref:hypothetical protein n=1 Tax=Frateuria soli TaxID=1542730 RepID=UPI001E3F84B0|nr:hypothetical protein [Frateuria soli]UGB38284.1 hypothetical protein LQ771_00040 [Frateuria soli]
MAEPAGRRVGVVLGGLGLLALSVAYCLPGHPSTRVGWLDVAAHVGLFALVATGGWLALRRGWTFVLVGALGLVLEIVQWRVGGYPRIEWPDILANEAGVALATLTTRLP